jgi:thioredoxin-like negative regulator of GroEL
MNDAEPSIEELERIVAQSPKDARAIVALANAYWLSGRGPDVVGELASRAIAADPDNRAGWHLWALSESNPRDRVTRWQQVSARFPEDHLARVNVADNAAALAGAEHDYDALDLAIATYQRLRDSAERPEERLALDEAITKLRGWRF